MQTRSTWQLDDNLYYRVDGHYFDRGDTVAVGGGNSHDAWRLGQGSFRLDWDNRKNGGDLLTLTPGRSIMLSVTFGLQKQR